MAAVELEDVPCYFCGASEGVVWGEEAGYRALKCAGCGLVYVTPRPRQEHIDEAARTGEHTTERNVLDVTGRYRQSRARSQERVIRRLFGDLPADAPLRWLDVGAGFGELVEAAGRVFARAEVTGVEPNEAKRRAAAERGLRLDATALTDLPQHSFDVVSFMNIWSHLPDPETFFRDARSLLAEKGNVLVQTGTGGDLETAAAYPDALLLPDHLSFAGERHVIGILERVGFRVDDVHRERLDTLRFTAESVAKRVLGRPARLTLPYRSSFRALYVRARI
jgi:2-polyprenyl-3-methyl-5-hydroxy-6-metoxy-1,4-benzoquinol methylase